MNGPSAFRTIILAVDDEPEDLERVERELGKRYEADYSVACEVSAEAGLRRLQDLKSSGEDVAVVLADQRMPGMEGIEFLSRAHQLHPSARRLLLIDPMDGVSFVRASPHDFGNECSRGIRRRRREASIGETGRLGRRRGLDRHPADPRILGLKRT